MFIVRFIKVVAISLLPFISFGQNYYNVFFMNNKDTLMQAMIVTKTISEAKTIATEISKDFKLKPIVRYWKRGKKGDPINYLIWK